MSNKRSVGICPECEEWSDRLFEPPVLKVLDSQVKCGSDALPGEVIRWHAPASGYPGTEPFTVIGRTGFLDDFLLLRPPETYDEPICWLCWEGRLWPALHPYLDNQPSEFVLNG